MGRSAARVFIISNDSISCSLLVFCWPKARGVVMTGLDGAGMTDCMICLAAGELIGLRVVDLDRKRLFKISVADGEETYAIKKLMN